MAPFYSWINLQWKYRCTWTNFKFEDIFCVFANVTWFRYRIWFSSKISSDKDANRCKLLFCSSSGSGDIREKHKFQNQLDVFFSNSLYLFRQRKNNNSTISEHLECQCFLLIRFAISTWRKCISENCFLRPLSQTFETACIIQGI